MPEGSKELVGSAITQTVMLQLLLLIIIMIK